MKKKTIQKLEAQRDTRNSVRNQLLSLGLRDEWMELAKVDLLPVFYRLIDGTSKRFTVYHGGRGGAKSVNVAMALVLLTQWDKLRIVCGRQFQNSIQESAYQEIVAAIDRLGVGYDFDVTEKYIKNKRTGARFIFRGVEKNPQAVKSLANVDIYWGEEANDYNKTSLDLLIPTIRKAGSRFIFTMNIGLTTDPMYTRFIENPNERTDCIAINYTDNPWCPQELIDEANDCLARSPEDYDHIWLGKPWTRSEASIFGKRIKLSEFDENMIGLPFQGIDWGFANDPTAGLEVYADDKRIYIRRGANKRGLTLRDTPAWIKENLPLVSSYKIYADSNWPQTVDHVKQEIPMLEAVKKWPNSVEEGVKFILGYDEIIVHPSVDKSVAQELRMYSYVVDKRTNEVTNVIEDANNHYADALRYALSKLILKKKGTKISFLD
jgi:phage terminase large subunit